MPQTIAVLDFGSQYTQVIARRIRECQVYSKIYHFSTPAETLRADGVIGIVLSGGPSSVFSANAPIPDPKIFEIGVPVLGILLRHPAHGSHAGRQGREGRAARIRPRDLSVQRRGRLFAACPASSASGIRHGDKLMKLPPGFTAIGRTENSPFAVNRRLPEGASTGSSSTPRSFTPSGASTILDNFLCRRLPGYARTGR